MSGTSLASDEWSGLADARLPVQSWEIKVEGGFTKEIELGCMESDDDGTFPVKIAVAYSISETITLSRQYLGDRFTACDLNGFEEGDQFYADNGKFVLASVPLLGGIQLILPRELQAAPLYTINTMATFSVVRGSGTLETTTTDGKLFLNFAPDTILNGKNHGDLRGQIGDAVPVTAFSIETLQEGREPKQNDPGANCIQRVSYTVPPLPDPPEGWTFDGKWLPCAGCIKLQWKDKTENIYLPADFGALGTSANLLLRDDGNRQAFDRMFGEGNWTVGMRSELDNGFEIGFVGKLAKSPQPQVQASQADSSPLQMRGYVNRGDAVGWSGWATITPVSPIRYTRPEDQGGGTFESSIYSLGAPVTMPEGVESIEAIFQGEHTASIELSDGSGDSCNITMSAG